MNAEQTLFQKLRELLPGDTVDRLHKEYRETRNAECQASRKRQRERQEKARQYAEQRRREVV